MKCHSPTKDPSSLTYAVLVFVARPLAVLGKGLQRLVDEGHVVLIDVEAQQTKSSSCRATNAVQEEEGLAHKVVIIFPSLIA